MTDKTVSVPQSAIDWLLGEGPDEHGEYFGDSRPDIAPRYWWRLHFRKLIASTHTPPPQTHLVAGEHRGIAELSGEASAYTSEVHRAAAQAVSRARLDKSHQTMPSELCVVPAVTGGPDNHTADHVVMPTAELLVGIKPLVWEQHGWVEAFSQPAGFGFWYSAIPEKPVRGPGDPPFKLNVIWGVPGNSERHCLGSNFASIEDAKAAAQSDYERRVRAAFAVLSAPEAEG